MGWSREAVSALTGGRRDQGRNLSNFSSYNAHPILSSRGFRQSRSERSKPVLAPCCDACIKEILRRRFLSVHDAMTEPTLKSALLQLFRTQHRRSRARKLARCSWLYLPLRLSPHRPGAPLTLAELIPCAFQGLLTTDSPKL